MNKTYFTKAFEHFLWLMWKVGRHHVAPNEKLDRDAFDLKMRRVFYKEGYHKRYQNADDLELQSASKKPRKDGPNPGEMVQVVTKPTYPNLARFPPAISDFVPKLEQFVRDHDPDVENCRLQRKLAEALHAMDTGGSEARVRDLYADMEDVLGTCVPDWREFIYPDDE